MQYSFGNYGFIQQGKMKEQPLVLLDIGIEHRQKENYCFDNRNRTHFSGYLLQYTLKGYGIYETDEKQYQVKEGMGFLVRMPENSRYYLPEEAEEWDFFYLHFDGDAAYPFFRTVQELTGSCFQLRQDCPVVRTFQQVFETCRQLGTLELYEGGEVLYRILSQLLRELEVPAMGGSSLIEKVSSYLKAHFASVSGIGETAQICGVSHEHLTRCFREETGQTPIQYLTRLRLEHAIYLLLNTGEPIQTVAVSCGFVSGNYFAKVFRQHLKCSPEEYRRRMSG